MTNKIIYGFLILIICFSCGEMENEYVCTPCGLSCDTLFFSKPGICPHCNMDLIKKSDLPEKEELVLNEINIQEGSDQFIIEGGIGNTDKTITIYYYKPRNFQATSKILMVIPGAGRNGDSYRDAWIEEADKYNILILSPMYNREEYDFAHYHMCGLISDLNLSESIVYDDHSNIAKLNEKVFTFNLNPNAEEWIFNDFDRIFDLAIEIVHSTQTQYEIFGHSAGGQILHRFAIFHKESKANRIIAANSGFYTLVNLKNELPFGVKNTSLNEEDLTKVFKKKLVVFNGELDNENETGGTLLRSATVDKQGLHRLERGLFFYNAAKNKAKELETEFNWKHKIIPGVGHDHKKIGNAVGRYLYEN